MEKVLKILVTGCNGYIGSHLCKVLHEAGHTIDGLDIEWKKHNNVMEYCTRIFVNDVTRFVLDTDYDVVVHLAGLIQVEESTFRPTKYYGVNLGGTQKILNQIKDHTHFIFASTAGAFDPANPYARSKIAAEDVIKENSKNYTIFRFFNVAGSDGKHRQVGKASHLIRIAAETAAGKRNNMSIYGDDYDTPDGTCVRDYIHVVDLVNAIRDTIKHGAFNTPYECIGSGKGYSVKEVVDTMKKVTGIDFEVKKDGRRSGDPAKLSIDNQFELLKPIYTIEDMCLSAYNAELTRGSN
jgi:UDP-glucose 4-epimerase